MLCAAHTARAATPTKLTGPQQRVPLADLGPRAPWDNTHLANTRVPDVGNEAVSATLPMHSISLATLLRFSFFNAAESVRVGRAR